MKIVIIKYNAGNIRSVDFALRRLGYNPLITSNHKTIKEADKVVFPGVGEAGSTMQYLRDNELDSLIRELTQPVFGICLGLQLLCSRSEEGDTQCIGIFDETVKKFDNRDKVPHMGWNTIHQIRGNILMESLDGQYVYFANSYYVPVCKYTAAITHYIDSFSSALEKDNFFATQFHPEKSGGVGEKILKRFLDL